MKTSIVIFISILVASNSLLACTAVNKSGDPTGQLRPVGARQLRESSARGHYPPRAQLAANSDRFFDAQSGNWIFTDAH
jgi:hypothetical protein